MYQISEESIICSYCEHLLSRKDRKCRAFEKIPLNIWEGLHDHKDFYYGDGGLRYLPAYDETDADIVLNDIETTIPPLSLTCSRCTHYRGGRECLAYEMIPLEIWVGMNDHTEEYPGDNGIRFSLNRG